MFFTLGLILINVALILIVEKYYNKPYNNIPINDQDEIFILADSHGLPLKQNLRESGIYNFAIGSDSYFDIYRKIVYLIKYTNMNKIIITADDHTLSIYRENSNNIDRSVKFIDYNDNDFLLENNYSLMKEKYLKRYLPIFNTKTTGIVEGFFRSMFKKPKVRSLDWDSFENKKKASKARAKLQFKGTNSSERLKSCIKEIVNLCKLQNIKIIAIKYPLSKDYLTEVNGRNFGADEYFAELGIKTYDFTKIYINNDEYFANQDHLNDLGGKKFADELKKRLNL
ncbi:MAG: hypothetical protein GQ534_08775 [Candidatus Delongbacteria bacterium]|nr:hypothetical protein [Candidatus Delongbacteria bacterium]